MMNIIIKKTKSIVWRRKIWQILPKVIYKWFKINVLKNILRINLKKKKY